ncbi:MAG: acetyl-CoA carboxylase biotin carboxyl carrier protein [Verrucomicrobiota bacterium]
MELKEIKELIALMKKNDLSVFKMEKEGFKITLKKGADFQPLISSVPSFAAPSTAIPAAPAAFAAGETPAASAGKEIVSPMVGTFYASASPESAPFAEVGTEVTADTVVCIIEAMKVMNEIKSEVSGVITEVLIENGKPVQFGQPLFKVK